MNPSTPEINAPPLELRVEHFIRATPARVFEAWTTPEQMRQWSAPEGMSIPEGDMDVRVGGDFRVMMVEPDGTRHVAKGTYREVSPPHRLVHTHAWVLGNGSGDGTSPETLVTVEFHAADGGTRMVLTQTGFESTDSRDGHVGGWTSTFRRLAAMLEGA